MPCKVQPLLPSIGLELYQLGVQIWGKKWGTWWLFHLDKFAHTIVELNDTNFVDCNLSAYYQSVSSRVSKSWHKSSCGKDSFVPLVPGPKFFPRFTNQLGFSFPAYLILNGKSVLDKRNCTLLVFSLHTYVHAYLPVFVRHTYPLLLPQAM